MPAHVDIPVIFFPQYITFLRHELLYTPIINYMQSAIHSLAISIFMIDNSWLNQNVHAFNTEVF